jgi:hypothetical protein
MAASGGGAALRCFEGPEGAGRLDAGYPYKHAWPYRLHDIAPGRNGRSAYERYYEDLRPRRRVASSRPPSSVTCRSTMAAAAAPMVIWARGQAHSSRVRGGRMADHGTPDRCSGPLSSSACSRDAMDSQCDPGRAETSRRREELGCRTS